MRSRVLDANAWAYVAGAAGDGITAARQPRRPGTRCALLPRVLQPLAGGHTRVAAAGPHAGRIRCWWRRWPTSAWRIPTARLATALAAAAQGAGLVLSTQASMPLEAVAQRGAGRCRSAARLWFQLYLQPDRGVTRELVRRAEAAGFEALVLTVDAPVHGARDAERRAGFRLPPGIAAVNLPAAAATGAPVAGALFDGLLAAAPTWADVEWLRSITRLPLLLKGVLHPDDARQAVRARRRRA